MYMSQKTTKNMKKTQGFEKRKTVRRKGVHAKTKMSKLKGSKNYFKRYNKQGK